MRDPPTIWRDGQALIHSGGPPHDRRRAQRRRPTSPSRTSAPTTAPQLTGGEIEGTEIICPRHGARFCLRTGEALTPPAYEPVRVFETKIENGHLWVRAD